MAIFRAPNIPTDNLVSCVDPANHKSYDPSYSFSYDIVSNTNSTFSQINSAGVILNDGVGPRWSLNGTNQYIKGNSIPNGTRPTESELQASGYTVHAWILPEQNGGGIFSNDAGQQSTYYGLDTFINASGNLGMAKYDGGGSSSSDRLSVLSTTTIQLNKWHFVSFSWFDAVTTGKWAIFQNGTQLSTSASGTGGSLSYGTGTRGGIGIQRTSYFGGGIGAVWIYNKFQSIDTHKQIYERTKEKYNNPA